VNCEHEDFAARVSVCRLLSSDGASVKRYTAEVTVSCTQCGTPFLFYGLPVGFDLNASCVSPDGREARLCVGPEGEVMPEVRGFTSYRITGGGLT
jgi:hypothetical protein